MKAENLVPQPLEKVQFRLSSYKLVPIKAGCYCITTFDNNILYIGLSENIHERLYQHLKNPDKVKPSEEGKAIWFYFMRYDKRNLQKLERTWLNQYVSIHGRLPILNKVNSPIT